MPSHTLRRAALPAALLVALSGCDVTESVGTTPACVSAAGAADQVARLTASADVGEVVTAANAFLATLSSSEQDAVLYDLTIDNANNWSNLPVGGMAARNGLRFDALSDTQLDAALAVADAALSDEGLETFNGIRAADEYLNTVLGANGYGDELYLIAFLGTPSTTDPWVLQLGGHHYALNFGFEGSVASPTPYFLGLEPLTFTLNGESYAPMAEHAETFTAIFDLLSSSELSAAQLSGTYNTILLGPGEDFTFPTQAGLQVSTLTTAQQDAVTAAITAYVEASYDELADDLIATYTSAEAYAETFVGWSGNTDLTTSSSYLRIDGPRAWIEISGEGGVVVPNQIHYHSIWRDKTLDYGGVFSTGGGTSTEPGPC